MRHLPTIALVLLCLLSPAGCLLWLALVYHRPELAEGLCLASTLALTLGGMALGTHRATQPVSPAYVPLSLCRTEWCARCCSLQRADEHGRIARHNDKTGQRCQPRRIP